MARSSDLPAPPPLADLRADGDVALFLDFDGTLVELADEPDGIHVPEGLVDRLCSLSRDLDGRLAIVTGRALDDLEGHIGTPTIARAGSHGIDCRDEDGSQLGAEPDVLSDDLKQQVKVFAAAHALRYEAKTHGAALHFRGNPAGGDLATRFLENLASSHEGLTVTTGKAVAELLEEDADKGSAVCRFMEEQPFAGARPVFIGDDVTDEDGFAETARRGGIAILVGDRDSDNATHHLATVHDVRDWLGL